MQLNHMRDPKPGSPQVPSTAHHTVTPPSLRPRRPSEVQFPSRRPFHTIHTCQPQPQPPPPSPSAPRHSDFCGTASCSDRSDAWTDRALLVACWLDTVMASSLVALRTALESILVDPRYHDLLALLKTARNGAVYGTKVRFPHALVMIFLFRSGTFRQKVALVLRATKKHAMNLARFATIYKATTLALKYCGPNRGKE
ncbi:hypothetical protein E4U53_007849, partial [Claviceps sorghi]